MSQAGGKQRPGRSRPEGLPPGQRPAPAPPGGPASQRTLVELSLLRRPDPGPEAA
jgi:hypothetical protein